MNEVFRDKLTSAFPWFDVYVDCNEGWNELIWNMCREIDDAYFEAGRECDIDVLQCKEKYGELRIYYGYTDDNDEDMVSGIINKYYELSKSTCEICGAKGKLLGDDYWNMVRCEGCL